MRNKVTLLALALALAAPALAQQAGRPLRNIILLIGDGMGTAQVYSGLVAKKDALNIAQCRHIGFSITNSSNNFITDSAAGATAWAIGQKTYNGAIGVDSLGKPVPTILEIASKKGKATGLVATCSITHATPASFAAHQPSRKLDDEIAADIAASPVDVLIGGGLQYFDSRRKDGKDLTATLKSRGYTLATSMQQVQASTSTKLAGLVASKHLPKMSEGRGEYLIQATTKALETLNRDEDGFFIMIEGSQIDWGGHANQSDYIVQEMVDFDNAVGAALAFAKKDGNTLVIVTADHETGGYALTGGDLKKGTVEGKFIYGEHTGVMVPVFAYGPGAEAFMGIYHNHTIYHKMMAAFGF